MTTLRQHVRLTAAAKAKAVAGLDQVAHAALEAAQAHQGENDAAPSNFIELASRRLSGRSLAGSPTLGSALVTS